LLDANWSTGHARRAIALDSESRIA